MRWWVVFSLIPPPSWSLRLFPFAMPRLQLLPFETHSIRIAKGGLKPASESDDGRKSVAEAFLSRGWIDRC